MRLFKKWVMTATLVCGACVFTSCTNKAKQPSLKEELRALYGENKKITDGNYDRSLAVKCIIVTLRMSGRSPMILAILT